MARYGTQQYNTFKYGTGGVASLSVAPFTATATDYTSVQLSWLRPVGEYNAFRLVRNQDGYSDTAEDGLILLEQDTAETARTVRSFLDAVGSIDTAGIRNYVPLVPGRIAYYTLWLYRASELKWSLAGSVYAVVAGVHATPLAVVDGSSIIDGRTRNTHEKLMELLPRMYTSSTGSSIDEVDYNSALSKFLQGFSYTLDEMTTFLDLIQPVSEAWNYTPERLALEAASMGLPEENRISTRFLRKLVREASYIYKYKGTPKGISTFVEASTGYNTDSYASPNLMPSNQDSTFRNWQSYQTWLAAHTFSITAATATMATSTIRFTSANTFEVGQYVNVTGLTPSFLNVTNALIVAADLTSFTVSQDVADGSWTGLTGTAYGVSNNRMSFWFATGGATMTATNTVVPPRGQSAYLSTTPPSTSNAEEVNSLDDFYTAKVVTTGTTGRISYGVGDVITQTIPVVAGKTYCLSFYIRNVSGSANVSPYLRWYDYSGTELTASTGSDSALTSSWSKVVHRAVAPTGATYLGIEVPFSAAGTYYLDLFQVAESYDITAAYGNGTVAAYKCVNGFKQGDRVTITGMSASGLNVSNARVIYATPNSFAIYSTATGTATTGVANFSYDEAHGAIIRMEANKHNQLLNPRFQNVSGSTIPQWTLTGSPTVAAPQFDGSTDINPVITAGGTDHYVTLQKSSTFSIASSMWDSNVKGGDYYSFSVYARGTNLSVNQMPITLGLSATKGGSVINAWTDGTSGGNVYYVVPGINAVIGDHVTISGCANENYNISGVVNSVFQDGFTVAGNPSGAFNGSSSTTWPKATFTDTKYTANSSYTYTNQGSVTGYAQSVTSTTYVTSHKVSEGDIISITGFTGDDAHLNISSQTVTNVLLDSSGNYSVTVPIGASNPSSGVASGVTLTVNGQQQLSSAWQRFQVNLYIPQEYGSLTISPSVSVSPSSTLTLALYAAQVERRYTATDYFDGSYLNQDAFWENGANVSDSYVFENASYKLPHLADSIKEILPGNTPYRVELYDLNQSVATMFLRENQPVSGYTS